MPPSSRKARTVPSSRAIPAAILETRDEDYVPSDEEDDDEDEPSDDDEIEEPIRHSTQASSSTRRKRTIPVDDDEAEDGEEDSFHGQRRPRRAASRPSPSRRQEQRRRRRAIAEEEEEDGDGNEDGEDAAETAYDEQEDDDAAWVRANGNEATDDITGEQLQTRHVVWRSPDGSLVMRFNLSTMRKVAARAREWRMPPHFRTPIDQPMREQIARKFGTRALMPVWDGLGSSGGGSGYGGGGADGYLEASIGSSSSQDRTFFERLAEWEARRLSDVHNLYVCPICLLWLKSLKPETETEGVEASGEPAGRDGDEETAQAVEVPSPRRARSGGGGAIGSSAAAASSAQPSGSRRKRRRIIDSDDEEVVAEMSPEAGRPSVGRAAGEVDGEGDDGGKGTDDEGEGEGEEEPEGESVGEGEGVDVDEDDEDDDLAVYDPLSVLYGSRSIFAWHQRHGLPPEVGAAQCCFRKQSDLNLHLRHGHCLTPKVMRGTRERLGAYQIRGGDGLVHKYLSSLATSTTLSESQRRRAMSDGHVRGYWVSTITDVASTVDADEAGWFSRAALYLALYDEVEAQSRGALIVQADEALFGQRLATTSGASLSEARRSRPSGAASVAEARVFGMDAWRRLGFGGGDDDDLKNFMANDDEEEEEEGDGGGGGEMSHMALHMRHALGEESESGAGEDGEDDADEGEEEEGDEEEEDDDEGEHVEDDEIEARRREYEDDEDDEEGSAEDDEGIVTRRIEYDDELDDLDRAELMLKRRKKAAKRGTPMPPGAVGGSSGGGDSSRSRRASRREMSFPMRGRAVADSGATSSSARDGAPSAAAARSKKRVIEESDDEAEEHEQLQQLRSELEAERERGAELRRKLQAAQHAKRWNRGRPSLRDSED